MTHSCIFIKVLKLQIFKIGSILNVLAGQNKEVCVHRYLNEFHDLLCYFFQKLENASHFNSATFLDLEYDRTF